MSGVLVSALVLQRDGRMSHPRELYIERFGELAATGLPIVFFCDWQIMPSLPKWPNVTVIPVSFPSLPLHRTLMGRSRVKLPDRRNEDKDTYDYLVIQNSKIHFMLKAMDLCPEAQRLTWVDAGITYLFKDPATVGKLAKFCAVDEPRVPQLAIPGCDGWSNRSLLTNDVNWYFCGSLFTGTRWVMPTWYTAIMQAIGAILPKLTWEVNVWAAATHRLPPGLLRHYSADHDDTMVTNY